MDAKLLVLLIEPTLIVALISWFVYSTYFNPRRRRFRKLMAEFSAANKKHVYYMAEGDLVRAKEQLELMGKIVEQERGVM
jgi:hypothetical protein